MPPKPPHGPEIGSALAKLIQGEGLDCRVEFKTPETPADAKLRRTKEFWSFWIVVAFVTAAFILSTAVIIGPGFSPHLQDWASTIITAIVSAGVGVLAGKSTKRASVEGMVKGRWGDRFPSRISHARMGSKWLKTGTFGSSQPSSVPP